MNKRDVRSEHVHIKTSLKRKSSRPRSEGGIQNVEPRVECNSKLQRARFQGVSMQRRPSITERSMVLKNTNQQNTFKSNSMIIDNQIHPRRYSISNQNNSRRASIFTQQDVSIGSEINHKKKSFCTQRKIILITTLSILLVLIIALSIVLPLKLKKSDSISSNPATQNLACTSNSRICSTPIFYWNYYCNSVSYNYYSCCYLSPSSTQLTIQFQLQEDFSYWSFDDISATQNNGELLINGGFESNSNGWILTMSANATSSTYVHSQISSSHNGLAYLYGGSKYGPAFIKQTFNVVPGQNINVSFWWADGGNSIYVPGKICQAIVTLT